MLELLALLLIALFSEDDNGKVDPYKAAGIAWGIKGDMSADETARFGAMLGAIGAFDDNGDI